jgi:RNA polymerase-binding transcription factor
MSTHPRARGFVDPFLANAGHIWNTLHAEREEVCAALLAESRAKGETLTQIQDAEPSGEVAREIEWRHRELLQARMRTLDDALDRLMAGSYGRCSGCNRRIGERRLAADPAASLCLRCQRVLESDHRSVSG